MIRDVWFIARKDLRYMLRAKETILWVFFMPILFFFFIGNVTSSGIGTGSAGPDPLALEGAQDGGFLLEELARRLEERNYRIDRPGTDAEARNYSRRLAVPAAFTDSVLAGIPVTLTYRHGAQNFGGDYESIRVGRALYTVLADLLIAGESGQVPSAESFARLQEMPRNMTLAVMPAGERQEIPSGWVQTIPGTMVMFTLLVMTTSGAVLLVIERRLGLLRRLASTPIHRLSVVLGKWIGKYALGLVQIGFAMLAGTLLFKGMDWGPNLGWVIVVMMAYGGLMAAVGMVLGCLARTEGLTIAIGVVTANVLGALGGCWWPIEITPAWMQKLQLFLPTGWAMDALHRLISFGQGPAAVLPHLVAMLALGGILLAVSVRIFKYD